jgi:hypothetical protein
MDESLRRTVHKGTTKIERHHKFAKHLALGSGGHLRSNNPADQEKAIVYNELVTNAVALQNVADQTQALHALKSKGVNVRAADLAFLSPYATSKLKRFGDYPTDLKPEAMPTCTTLPLKESIAVADFARILPTGLLRNTRFLTSLQSDGNFDTMKSLKSILLVSNQCHQLLYAICLKRRTALCVCALRSLDAALRPKSEPYLRASHDQRAALSLVPCWLKLASRRGALILRLSATSHPQNR